MHHVKKLPINFVSFVAILVLSVSFFTFGRMWESTYNSITCVCRQKYLRPLTPERFSSSTDNYNNNNNLGTVAHTHDPGLLLTSKKLLAIAKRIARANRFARSGKVRVELAKAYSQLESLLSGSHRNYTKSLMEQKSYFAAQPTTKLEVCPERYMGMKYGFPYYQKGFVTEKCTAKTPPISSLVTIGLVLYFGTMRDNMESVLSGIEKEYPHISVIIGMVTENVDDETYMAALIKKHPNINAKLQVFTFLHSESHMWRSMAELASTKYFLVGRRLTHFLADSKLERLVRVANYTRADIVGGSHRDEWGFWSHGCHQTSMRNYDYRVVEGYDLSYNSCIYCDYLSGPFLVKPQVLINYISADIPDGSLIWLDFFEKLKVQTKFAVMSCPDSMYLTNDNRLSLVPLQDWIQFAQAWELDFVKVPEKEKIILPKSSTHRKCGYGIHGDKGETVPPSCLQELSDMLLDFIKLAEESGIRYMVKGGTVIGAVKFSGTLPWERDEDLYFHAQDYDKVLELTTALTSLGYYLDIDSVQTNYSDCLETFLNNSYHENDKCGVLALKNAHWRIQLYGVPYLDDFYWRDKYQIQNVTKVQFEGQWVNAPFNPLNYARNFYGDDIFAHVEHWIGQGRNDWWNPLESGKFQRCPRLGFHGCLDQFLPTGSIQFDSDFL